MTTQKLPIKETERYEKSEELRKKNIDILEDCIFHLKTYDYKYKEIKNSNSIIKSLLEVLKL